jgi:hypothetical protein
VFFAAFVLAGWVYRTRPQIHKRLMLVATTIVAMPAISRMAFLGTPPSLADYMLVWPLRVDVAMMHDYATARRIHPVYAIGVLAMLAQRLVLPLGRTDTWTKWSARFVPLYQ